MPTFLRESRGTVLWFHWWMMLELKNAGEITHEKWLEQGEKWKRNTEKHNQLGDIGGRKTCEGRWEAIIRKKRCRRSIIAVMEGSIIEGRVSNIAKCYWGQVS